MPGPSVSILATVLDNSNRPVSKGYTLSNTPFYFKPIWDGESINYSQYEIIWDFGDGTTFLGLSATHVYKLPGIYPVTATFFNRTGQAFKITSTTSLSVYNVMPDTLIFDRLTPTYREGLYLLPAGKKSEPLKIYRYNSWQNDKFLSKTNYTINLYASGSNSTYYSPEEYYKGRYSHLRNFFGFIETEVNNDTSQNKIINKTTTSSVSVYAIPNFDEYGEITFDFTTTPNQKTAFAGTSGSTTTDTKYISYIDQTPSSDKKNTLIYLFAHIDSTGFEDSFTFKNNLYTYLSLPAYSINNTAWQTQYLKSVFNPAEKISITSNGITVEGDVDYIGSLSAQQVNYFNIYPIKWADSKISFCCTFKDSSNFTTKNYPNITKFRFDGKHPTEVNTVSLSLVSYKDQTYNTTRLFTKDTVQKDYERVEDAIFEKNDTVPVFKNSSYFCGMLRTRTSVNAAVISACALIQDEPVANLGITYGYVGQPGLKNIKKFNKKIIMDHCGSENLQFKVLTDEVYTINTIQDSSVGISVLPLGSFNLGENRIYVTDSDNDMMKVYTPEGYSVGNINFRNALIYTGSNTVPISANLLGDLDGATPASIALNSKGDAWVSLYDAVSCFKFDYSTLTITACAVPPLNNTYYDTSSYFSTSGFSGENSLLPACLDVDSSDNLIVGYSHPISGFIIKYNNDGIAKKVIALPQFTTVQEIIADKFDNVYAVVKDMRRDKPNPHYVDDFVYKWDQDLNLIKNFPVPIKNIGSATIDLNQNLYVNNGASKFTRITPTGDLTEIILPVNPETFMQYIGGIACDEEGFLWIVHNQTGKMYFYPIDTLIQLPLSGVFCGDLPDIQLITPNGSPAHYSAVGDWTGVRWINKFLKKNTPAPRYIYGTSNLFTIKEDKPVISKINEDYDQAATFKGYVLQESLLNKSQFFDNFLGQIVGDSDSLPTELGKTIFEKIANFTSNVSDVDRCELDSLLSMHSQMGKDLPVFGATYPPKLRRVMNLLSQKQSKLFGSPNTYRYDFNNRVDGNSRNLGEEIDIISGYFIAGEPIVTFENFSQTFKLVYNTLVPETNGIVSVEGSLYPLSGINYNWGWGLVLPDDSIHGPEIAQFYKFYKYIPYMPLNAIDSSIDFNNIQTTYTNTQSSYNDWTKYGGIMDQAISRALYEGLNLYDNF